MKNKIKSIDIKDLFDYVSNLQDRINKAYNKIENMFDRGEEETLIDDLLELQKILKGE